MTFIERKHHYVYYFIILKWICRISSIKKYGSRARTIGSIYCYPGEKSEYAGTNAIISCAVGGPSSVSSRGKTLPRGSAVPICPSSLGRWFASTERYDGVVWARVRSVARDGGCDTSWKLLTTERCISVYWSLSGKLPVVGVNSSVFDTGQGSSVERRRTSWTVDVVTKTARRSHRQQHRLLLVAVDGAHPFNSKWEKRRLLHMVRRWMLITWIYLIYQRLNWREVLWYHLLTPSRVSG